MKLEPWCEREKAEGGVTEQEELREGHLHQQDTHTLPTHTRTHTPPLRLAVSWASFA